MIVHRRGADTTLTFAWDDGDLTDGGVQPSAVEFDVWDEDGSAVLAWTLADAALVLNEDYSFDLAIPHDHDFGSGDRNLSYRLRAQDPIQLTWTIVSAGLLRVRG